jgi:hypothetical protein
VSLFLLENTKHSTVQFWAQHAGPKKRGKSGHVMHDKTAHQTAYRVGIHRANFADFILDLRNCYSQSCIYIGFTHLYRFVKSILLRFGLVWFGFGFY